MLRNEVVSGEKWVAARVELLRKEKELTRLQDELARERRTLPWVLVTKDYTFDGPSGKRTLADLFGRHSQLAVYHFMFDPDWEQGCKSCSLAADHFEPSILHLAHRDVSFAAVSRAPIAKLTAFQKRMEWEFPWVSSFGNSFNRDFAVTFTPEEVAAKATHYNYQLKPFGQTEAPGLSVFVKDEDGAIFHTYSCYGRGVEWLLGVYNFLDRVPKGRDEDGLPYGMDWVRHHDRYETAAVNGR